MRERNEAALTPTQVATLRALVDAGRGMAAGEVAEAASTVSGRPMSTADASSALGALAAAGLSRAEASGHGRLSHGATPEGVEALRAFKASASHAAGGWSDGAVAWAVLEAARLGAVLDGDGMRRVLDVAGRPDERRDRADALRCRLVTEAAEEFVSAALPSQAVVCDGLAARPRPGAKAAATDAVRDLVGRIGALRRVIRSTRTVRLVASGGPSEDTDDGHRPLA